MIAKFTKGKLSALILILLSALTHTQGSKAQCPANAGFNYYVQSCETYQFTDLSTSSNPNYVIVSWSWDFGDGGTSAIQNPVHTFAAGATYNVSLTITADSSGVTCTDDVTHPVVVDDSPVVYFTWDPEPTCFGSATSFFGTTSASAVSWTWDFGDGGASNIQNPIHLYTSAGTYTVTAEITDINGCTATESHDVTVSDIPGLDFTFSPDPSCVDQPTDFSGTSSGNITTWNWDFGDGYTANTQNTTHSFETAGTYNVSLSVTDASGCTNSISYPVQVNALPMPNFQHSAPTCFGDSTHFTDYSTTPNGYIQTWEWDFGDGTTTTISYPDNPNISHLYDDDGDYIVSLTVTDSDGCISSMTKTVSVVPNPVANFTYDNACYGDAVDFTDQSSVNNGSQIISWFWNFDDPASGTNNTSILQNPTHLFTDAGTFEVRLVVTNQAGCSDTIIEPVSVNIPSGVDFTADRDTACVMEIIQFDGMGTDIVSWYWEFGDGGTDIVQDPEYAYFQAGTYNVTLTVTDINGCTNSVSHPVNIKQLPNSLFDVSSPTCQSDSVYFTDYSTSPSGYIVSWHWYFGDGTEEVINFPDDPNVAHLYTNNAIFSPSLVVTDLYGCTDSSSMEIEIVASPIAQFDYAETCYNEPVLFEDESLPNGGGNIVNWYWDFGDPLTGTNNFSTLQNPIHIFSDSGSFIVTLQVTNATGCQDTISQEVFINSLPDVDFTVNPDSTCVGSITYFNGTGSDIISWFWEFGDGGTANVQNPPHIYTEPGTYDVTLTVINLNGCSNSVTHTVWVNAQPTPLFSIENQCYTDSTYFFDESFVNNSIINSWTWNFDDPASGASNTSILQNPAHYFTNFGTYDVKLVVTDINGCTDSLTRQISIFDKPEADYVFDLVCEPHGTVYFTDESEPGQNGSIINSWLWEIDEGYYSTEQNPHYTFAYSDTCYPVTLTVTDLNQCSSSYIDTVCINDELSVDFTATEVCLGEPTFFDASFLPVIDSVVSWKWEFGDGSTFVTTAYDTISHTYQEAGNFQVVLTATNTNDCESNIYHTVTVNPLPMPDFTASIAKCDEPTEFTDLSIGGGGTEIISWFWNFGDIASGSSNFSTNQHPSHIYGPEDSTYFATLSITNQNGCTDSITLPVEKNPCVTAGFTLESDPLCNGQEVCFSDSSYIFLNAGTITEWFWDFGDGQTLEYDAYEPIICHTFTNAGVYDVKLIITGDIDGSIIMDSTNKTILINPSPMAQFSNSASCGNTEILFTDESSGNGMDISQWHWDFGDPGLVNDTSDLQNPVYMYSQSGNYEVEFRVTNEAGCTDTYLKTIAIFPRPTADFEFEAPCIDNPTFFEDLSDTSSSAIIHWAWNFGDTLNVMDTSNLQNPAYNFDKTGTYDVSLVITDQNQCMDTLSQSIQIFDRPISSFVFEENYQGVQGQVFFENRSIGANAYFWNFDNGDSSYLEEPTTNYNEDGTYDIMLVAFNNRNCTDTSHFEYKVILKGLYIPNAFAPLSPNPDVRLFKPKGYNLKEYRIQVFSAWGELVWSSTELDGDGRPVESWDGRYEGQLLPQGAYIWKVKAVFRDNSIWEGSDIGDGNTKNYGSVTLIH